MEAIGEAPALVSGGLLLLGALLGWLFARRHQAGLHAQIRLLQGERHRFAGRLRAGRERIHALRKTVARLEQINGRLLQEQERLEAEQDKLTARCADLDARLQRGSKLPTLNPAAEVSASLAADAPAQRRASVTTLTRPRRRPPSMPAYAQAADSRESLSQRHATVPMPADHVVQCITTDLGPDSLNEEAPSSDPDGLTTIEKVSTRLPLTLIRSEPAS